MDRESVRLRLIHLHRSEASSRPLIRKLLKNDPTLASLYQLSIHDFKSNYFLSLQRARQLVKDLHDASIMTCMGQEATRFKIWTILDEDYPHPLRMIPDPPYVLYGLGDADLIHHMPSISVVGTRHPSPEAKQKMYQLLRPLIDHDWLLVSGMALGIDSYAHRIASYYKGKTIAVLGSGLQHPYPKQNLNLFNEMIHNQLVVSEYPPFTRPERYHFPERNRIISGLTFGTVVIEAKERSGSLITAEQALEQGREVFAVPGSIINEQVKGCHKLIQDGAKLVQNTYDLIEEWQYFEEKWCRTLLEYQ